MIQSRFTDDERRALEGAVVCSWIVALAVAWIASVATTLLVDVFPDRPVRDMEFWAFFPALAVVVVTACLVGRLGFGTWVTGFWGRRSRNQAFVAAEGKLTRRETWALYSFGITGLPLGIMVMGHRLTESWAGVITLIAITLFGWLYGEIRWGWRQPEARLTAGDRQAQG